MTAVVHETPLLTNLLTLRSASDAGAAFGALDLNLPVRREAIVLSDIAQARVGSAIPRIAAALELKGNSRSHAGPCAAAESGRLTQDFWPQACPQILERTCRLPPV